ncbi:fungal-specific transcription factor domain-containing protein [Colletotrichum navitas]|uniref:Fungal-specific transcription factor domain-containing protein n=1 Tax=Colletotrichum navitas TaxID=681940 RepID=A0AAD8PR20_9PEZI|nr:fungal-specific transcription factor domain-containing protein [Colletotrichum navitas]KAK1574726.1 fungal-specific transcription factor domain-containing protein [Colletotrichum navitas]
MARIGVLNAPTKPCHNCRRRRWRCDRSYPRCHKCTTGGHECLGYGKLFRWTEGVASRGKLAGKTTITFSADTATTATTPSRASTLEPSSVSATPSASPSASTSVPDRHHYHHHDSPTSAEDCSTALVVSNVRPAGIETQSAPWTLVDPLFQGVEHHYRHYLSYFTTRVCKDLVSWDLPDRNPFRSLIPLTKAHPLLQHIIVAASAAHMSNLSRALSSDPESDLNARQALTDALVAKQKALRLLSSALQDIGGTGGDVVLSSVLFFVNVELMESGRDGWKPHLEGAGRIMSYLSPVGMADSALRDYVMSDCFIYYILASAFNASTPAAKSYYHSAQVSSVLGKAAANSYFCCPPDILQILLTASQLSNRSTEDLDSAADVAQGAAQILQQALSFDVNDWAYEPRTISYFRNIPVESRIHAGSAHRLAACLYILHALPSASILVPVDREELDSQMFYHLSCIHDEDPNFKATCLPTFIAGAGTSDPERRKWILDRLRRLMIATPWGFIMTAMDMLQTIWNLEESVDPHTQTERTWVQKLKASNLNFLIV